jgi:glycerate-2-kinase
LIDRFPSSVSDYLIRAAERDPRADAADTPGHVLNPRIAPNALPVEAAFDVSRGRGFEVIGGPRLRGEASDCGRQLAATLISAADGARADTIVVSGGETTVTLSGASGSGGRCQELALSAAQALAEFAPVTLLVAGTDGRDGPTDAAGAVVDGSTWSAIASSGREPGRDLERHDSYHSLDSAGALLRTGHSGTNMMDVAIAILRK